MAQAQFEKDISVGKKKFFEIISQYEKYPEFVSGVNKIEVQRKAPGKARVTYHISIMKDIEYVIDITEDYDAGRVYWTLVESDMFKKNDGSWQITEKGPNQIHIVYSLDVEFKISVPGFILKKLVSGNLPSMVASFEKRAING
jgi:ribosome-associated toxin RatA of RatAB toxin-antitoxin module